MPRFRKKPVVIDAIQYDEGVHNATSLRDEWGLCWDHTHATYMVRTPHIHTLEGLHHVNHGDWIIKGVEGEFYPCKPRIFDATYEAV